MASRDQDTSRRCVLCHAYAHKGRAACPECGGAVVNVVEDNTPATVPAATPAAAMPGYATPDVDYGYGTPDTAAPAAPTAWAPPPEAAPPDRDGRSTRAVWAARFMMVAVVVILIVGAVLAWNALTGGSTEVASSLKPYVEDGVSKPYITKAFSVAMPEGYTTYDTSTRVQGATIDMKVAAANLNGSLVEVASGPMDRQLTSSIYNLQEQIANEMGRTLQIDGLDLKMEPVEWEGMQAWDLSYGAPGGQDVEGRIAFFGSRVIVFLVVTKQGAEPTLDTLVDSFAPVGARSGSD